jgi:F0F1-type ATP synthase gamma subunit
VPKKNGQILALDRNFLKAESTIIRTFDQLKTLKKFDQVMKSDEILIKTFDQVKNDNFDQVKFDQVIVCHQKYQSFVFSQIRQNKLHFRKSHISEFMQLT